MSFHLVAKHVLFELYTTSKEMAATVLLLSSTT